ncbi:MAG: hypothetical protein QOH61_2247 [Chloroflexota bacterium]|jgi:plastocyanin|nr:hypothetical protein [Chloroflexota bacterium]
MRTLSRRSIAAIAPSLLAAATIALVPGTAAAATRNVSMDVYDFTPATITIARGDIVKWTNDDFTAHDVQAQRPYRLFRNPGGAGSPIPPNGTYSYTFTSAGRFPYVCLTHSSDGMQGTVVVPITLTRLNTSPEKFKVTVGSLAIPANQPWVRVVQVDLPSTGTHWVSLNPTRAASVTYKPTAHGTYRFRSYLKSTGSSGQSDPSPVKSLSH